MMSSSSSSSPYTNFITKFSLDYKRHQDECVEWCMQRETAHPQAHGGLIADDMGLGKTIQIIALMHANDTPTTRTLIVVPVALLQQWYDALRRTPFEQHHPNHHHHPQTILYHGRNRAKTTQEQLAAAKVVITTYGEITRTGRAQDNPTFTPASPVHTINWTRIVFDEAHHLRNKDTKVHQAALHLNTSASNIRWLLTGTPIQNSRDDFYALCDVIGVPKSLQDKANLRTLTKKYLMKRTKKQLAIPMPELKEHVIRVEWSNPTEREFAEQLNARVNYERENKRKQRDSDDNDDDNAEQQPQPVPVPIPDHQYKFKAPEFNSRLTDYLRARQMCILPSLLTPELHHVRTDEAANPTTEATETREFMESALRGSSKLDAIIQHVITSTSTSSNTAAITTSSTPTPPPPPPPRSIIFCEFRKEMDYLQQALSNYGIYAERVDGTTPQPLKQAILNSTHINVLLLQIKTCSEGLNLQQYTNIYIVTPQWNPCVEAQAICRSYRIGQTNPVNVYRFVMATSDTTKNIESYVVKKQAKKIAEANQVQDQDHV